MSAPRVLGYDELHGWLEGMAADSEDRAEDLMTPELDVAPDAIGASWQEARAEAFRAVLAHIEREMAWNRG